MTEKNKSLTVRAKVLLEQFSVLEKEAEKRLEGLGQTE